MPATPMVAPRQVDRISMRLKLLVSSRAVTAGTTRVAAIIVTPTIFMEAMMAMVKMQANTSCMPGPS